MRNMDLGGGSLFRFFSPDSPFLDERQLQVETTSFVETSGRNARARMIEAKETDCNLFIERTKDMAEGLMLGVSMGRPGVAIKREIGLEPTPLGC